MGAFPTNHFQVTSDYRPCILQAEKQLEILMGTRLKASAEMRAHVVGR